jgi:hypothetical protein
MSSNRRSFLTTATSGVVVLGCAGSSHGDHGFERAVADVATLARAFGLDDLAKRAA